MDATFSRGKYGVIHASLGDDMPIFNTALWDSISTVPPVGPGSSPSTYWIDVAEREARRAAQSGDEAPFLRGNRTELRVLNGEVAAANRPDDARHAYDDYDRGGEEHVPLHDFLDFLAEWRRHVLAAPTDQADGAFPQRGRRDPWGQRQANRVDVPLRP